MHVKKKNGNLIEQLLFSFLFLWLSNSQITYFFIGLVITDEFDHSTNTPPTPHPPSHTLMLRFLSHFDCCIRMKTDLMTCCPHWKGIKSHWFLTPQPPPHPFFFFSFLNIYLFVSHFILSGNTNDDAVRNLERSEWSLVLSEEREFFCFVFNECSQV